MYSIWKWTKNVSLEFSFQNLCVLGEFFPTIWIFAPKIIKTARFTRKRLKKMRFLSNFSNNVSERCLHMDHWWIDINLRETKLWMEEAKEPEMRAPPQSYTSKCITFNGSYCWCCFCGFQTRKTRQKWITEKLVSPYVHVLLLLTCYSILYVAITSSPTFT